MENPILFFYINDQRNNRFIYIDAMKVEYFSYIFSRCFVRQKNLIMKVLEEIAVRFNPGYMVFSEVRRVGNGIFGMDK